MGSEMCIRDSPDSGPSAEELQTQDKALKQKLEVARTENRRATQALEIANANLETAKSENDASGIATAANEIAAAAGKVSDSSGTIAELEAQLGDVSALAADAEKKQTAGGNAGPGFITATVDNDLVFAVATDAYDPDVLDQLLGMDEPESSLEKTGKLKKIRSEWNLSLIHISEPTRPY